MNDDNEHFWFDVFRVHCENCGWNMEQYTQHGSRIVALIRNSHDRCFISLWKMGQHIEFRENDLFFATELNTLQ